MIQMMGPGARPTDNGAWHELVRRALTIGLALAALTGCGKAVGRLPFAAEGTQSAVLPLAAGDVAFWTDIDVKYEGAASLAYKIDLQQGGASVATALCDPLGELNIKVGWVETSFGSSVSRSGSGKMACRASLPKAGPTTVQATLAFGVKPAVLALSKADLVVKQ